MGKSRSQTDWETELQDDEMMDDKTTGKKVVFLRGLQRLAEEAGLVRSDLQLHTPDATMVQCIYRTWFSDDTQWVGAADCSAKNSEKPFRNYPTALAESRAEARCLRKALGIRMLSAEEISFEPGNMEASPSKGIESSVVLAIERLCEERGVDKLQVVEKVVEDPARAHGIFELKQLNTAEGQKALSYLNDLPLKKKTAPKESKRDERKKELLAQKEKAND